CRRFDSAPGHSVSPTDIPENGSAPPSPGALRASGSRRMAPAPSRSDRHVEHGRWVRLGDPEQHPRRTLGPTAPLLPVLERLDADAQERRELGLAQMEARPQPGDIHIPRHDSLAPSDARRAKATRLNRLHFPDAFLELGEQVLPHCQSPSPGAAALAALAASYHSARSSDTRTADRS